MISSELSPMNAALSEPVSGVLDERWSIALERVMARIERKKDSLISLTRIFYKSLQDMNRNAVVEGKNLHLIYLTRQAIPIYWSLKGICDANGQELLDYDVLGIKATSYEGKIGYAPQDREQLNSILRIGDDRNLNVFVDDHYSSGTTIRGCFSLVALLGGEEKNYQHLIFSPDINVPWDMRFDGSEKFTQTDPRFLSLHLYLSPKASIDCGQASPAILNGNYNSHIMLSQIAQKLYEIGREAAG